MDCFLNCWLHLGAALWPLPVLDGSCQIRVLLAALNRICQVLDSSWWFCTLWHGSGMFHMVVVGFGSTFRFSSRVLILFKYCLIAIASSRWFWPVQESCGFVWILVVGSMWSFKVLTVFDGCGLFHR